MHVPGYKTDIRIKRKIRYFSNACSSLINRLFLESLICQVFNKFLNKFGLKKNVSIYLIGFTILN